MLLVGLIGLGMGLSGCVTNSFKNTLVKDKYIQDYVKKNANIKPKKIGDSNIKFYVEKVVDARKGHKYIYRKMGPFGIPAATTKIDNVILTLTNLTKKALVVTGWGVTNNKVRADYIVIIKLNSLGYYNYVLIGYKKTNATITVDNKKMYLILRKEVKHYTPNISVGVDFSNQFKFAAGKACVDYYELLVNFFGSKEFKNAIMRDYLSHLPSVDNATSSVNNATE